MTPEIECDKFHNLQITFQSLEELYAAYMPFIKGRGLFITTTKTYQVGEELSVSIKLLAETKEYVLVTRAIWLTPINALDNRPAGIGIQLSGEEAESLRNTIEAYLAGYAKSGQLTYTL